MLPPWLGGPLAAASVGAQGLEGRGETEACTITIIITITITIIITITMIIVSNIDLPRSAESLPARQRGVPDSWTFSRLCRLSPGILPCADSCMCRFLPVWILN